ncbi:MAG: 50S ribosomal protein L11 methyltransferase [Lysobacteraceae bacterium]
MPYLELGLRCPGREQPRYEAALEDIGALSVTSMDADADTPDEQAILEPGVGETPVWPEVRLGALFQAGTDPERVLAMLEAFDPGLDLDGAVFSEVEDQDWERAWLDQFKPMRFGRRTWIVPWNHALPAEAGDPAAVVRLDPGLAFGSGTHPTTALCLAWLDGLADEGALEGAAVLDYGCGSGILALAGLKLGAASALGIDNDPQAIVATLDNAQRNAVDERLQAALPADSPPGRFPVVVANILASALDALAADIAERVQPGGRIALSGILPDQADALLARYGEWFDDLHVEQLGDWVRIDGRRR